LTYSGNRRISDFIPSKIENISSQIDVLSSQATSQHINVNPEKFELENKQKLNND